MNFEKPQFNKTEIEGTFFSFDENGFVRFGDVARSLLQQQAQYASRYTDGTLEDYPNLGKELKFEGNSSDYHSLKIHKDDIQEFINRVRKHREQL
ncbi:MAG: hypothetical protein ACKUBY_03915 [Candidatus Moraniibacteriota bacterium]|jgi:hypothetical protein